MTIVEHIKEFRRRLLISLAGIIVGTIIAFVWYDYAIGSIPTLGNLLRDPYCSLPAEARYAFSDSDECRLLATGPFDPFMLRLKVAALAGLVIASPVWLSQLWGFITPGLMKNERRYTAIFVTIAVLLFVGGAVLAYFVVAYGLEFLLTIGGDTQAAALTGERYFNFLLALLMIFGVSFEVPLVISMLNVAGILTYDAIKDKRRMIIMILFVFAAFMTPGQDPFTMLVLAISLTILVELAIQFCRINDKRRAKKRPEWLDADDLSASPLDTSAGGEDAPSPVEMPEPVTPSPKPQASEDASISYKPGRIDFGDVL
ncbi:twin-arginine translocase subunit TatC [Corynebacterium deserti]|nr:twin-arginine translocase subunit TatC [Corynebacterium deserti]